MPDIIGRAFSSSAAFASPRSYAPGPVTGGGGGRNWRGPQDAQHPRFEFSEECKRVRGCYEPAFGSLPASWASPSANFEFTVFCELRPNGVLPSWRRKLQ